MAITKSMIVTTESHDRKGAARIFISFYPTNPSHLHMVK